MPEPVSIGFYGKLPSRGDFLRVGLPRSFTDPWDAWMQLAITSSRAALGEDWLASWMEAPIWRFSLPDFACGPDAALGLFLPSVDRAGRHFPLVIAVLSPGAAPDAMAASGSAWLDAAEQAGLDALEHLLSPEDLTAALPPSPPACVPGPGDAVWWTAGSPFVPPTSFRHPGLPDPAGFATMLRDSVGRRAEAS